MRKGLFEKVESFSFKNTDHFTTPSLITRLTNDVNNIQQSFQMIIRMLARAPFMMILATIMAIRISTRLSIVILCAIPILSITMAILAKLAFPRFEAMLKKYDLMNARTQENLVAIRVVKAFVRGDYESKKFEDAAAALKNAQRKAEKLLVFAMPVMQFTMYLCILLVLWLGGNDILGGRLMTGELMSFLSYISQILMSLMMITMVFVMLVLSSASAKRIIEVLDETPAINDDAADKTLSVKDGSIEFRDVSFSYADDPENLALSHIDLSIRSGETIGIIGGSGSAKSTLVQLIPRLYEAFSGEVLVGGHSVKDYEIPALRESIGMVLQKNVLFSGTIKENLRWGNPNATDEELVSACVAAQADGFIRSFPNGLRYRARSGRCKRLRRAEAAPLYCPRARKESKDSDSGRLDERRGHRDGRGHPRGLPSKARGRYDAHHRAAHHLRHGRGPHPCSQRREDRRRRHPRGTDANK